MTNLPHRQPKPGSAAPLWTPRTTRVNPPMFQKSRSTALDPVFTIVGKFLFLAPVLAVLALVIYFRLVP